MESQIVTCVNTWPFYFPVPQIQNHLEIRHKIVLCGHTFRFYIRFTSIIINSVYGVVMEQVKTMHILYFIKSSQHCVHYFNRYFLIIHYCYYFSFYKLCISFGTGTLAC